MPELPLAEDLFPDEPELPSAEELFPDPEREAPMRAMPSPDLDTPVTGQMATRLPGPARDYDAELNAYKTRIREIMVPGGKKQIRIETTPEGSREPAEGELGGLGSGVASDGVRLLHDMLWGEGILPEGMGALNGLPDLLGRVVRGGLSKQEEESLRQKNPNAMALSYAALSPVRYALSGLMPGGWALRSEDSLDEFYAKPPEVQRLEILADTGMFVAAIAVFGGGRTYAGRKEGFIERPGIIADVGKLGSAMAAKYPAVGRLADALKDLNDLPEFFTSEYWNQLAPSEKGLAFWQIEKDWRVGEAAGIRLMDKKWQRETVSVENMERFIESEGGRAEELLAVPEAEARARMLAGETAESVAAKEKAAFVGEQAPEIKPSAVVAGEIVPLVEAAPKVEAPNIKALVPEKSVLQAQKRVYKDLLSKMKAIAKKTEGPAQKAIASLIKRLKNAKGDYASINKIMAATLGDTEERRFAEGIGETYQAFYEARDVLPTAKEALTPTASEMKGLEDDAWQAFAGLGEHPSAKAIREAVVDSNLKFQEWINGIELDELYKLVGKERPKPTRGIRKAIDIITGVKRVDETVGEGVALKAAMKKAEWVSRKAYSAGFKEAKDAGEVTLANSVEKAKAILEEVKTKAGAKLEETKGIAAERLNTVREKLKEAKEFGTQELADAVKGARQALSVQKYLDTIAAKEEKFAAIQKLRALYVGKAEVAKVNARMFRTSTSSGIGVEYLRHIRQIIGNHYKLPSMPKGRFVDAPPVPLRPWAEAKVLDGELPPQILDFLDDLDHLYAQVSPGMTMPAKGLTMDELKTVDVVVQMLAHAGRWEAEAARVGGRYEAAIAGQDAAREIYTTWGGKSKFPKMEKQEMLDRAKQTMARLTGGVKDVFAVMQKIEHDAVALDGFKPLGKVQTNVITPLAKSQGEEYIKKDLYDNSLKKAFNNLLKDVPIEKRFWSYLYGRNHSIPGMSWKLTKQEMLMVAANAGHEYNRAALQLSEQFSEKQIDAILSALSPKEKQFVMDIWDAVSMFKDDLKRAVFNTTGYDMPEVEGFYFPVHFDYTGLADKKALSEAQKDLFGSLFPSFALNKGMTIKRQGTGGLPLNLDFDVIFKHGHDTIHYMTHAEALQGVQRFVNQADFKEAVTKTFGKEMHDQFMPWLHNIANPRRDMGFSERLLARARKNVSMAYMGFKFSTAFAQLESFDQTIAALNQFGFNGGREWAAGQVEILKDPLHWKRFIDSVSPMMAFRYRSWERDVVKKGFTNPFGFSPGEAIDSAAYLFMKTMDGFTTYTSWFAGYRTGLKHFGMANEAKAIEFADSIVRLSQGSGSPLEQSVALVGGKNRSEWKKLFTMFWTFFNTRYALKLNAIRKARMPGQPVLTRAGEAFESLIWLVAAPAIVGTALNRGKEVTPEDIGKSLLMQPFADIPGVRDVANAWVYKYGYQATPIGGVATDLIEGLGHGNWGRAGESALSLSGFPTRQAFSIWDGVEDLGEGRAESNWHLIWPEKKAIEKRRADKAREKAKERQREKFRKALKQ